MKWFGTFDVCVKYKGHLLCLIVVACSGCIPVPYRAVVRPGVNGFIVDAQTGQPIAGAKATMDSTQFFMAKLSRNQLAADSSESMTNGSFSLPPQHRWRVEPTPNFASNDGWIECHLLVEHAGYEPYRWSAQLTDASLFWPMPSTTNLSRISLQPLHR